MIDPDIAMKGFLTADATVGGLIGNKFYDTFGVPNQQPPYIICVETPHSTKRMTMVGFQDFEQMNYDIHCYGTSKTQAKALSGAVQEAFQNLVLAPATLPVILSVAKAPTIGLHLFTINGVLSNHVMGINKTKKVSYRYVIDMSMAFKEK